MAKTPDKGKLPERKEIVREDIRGKSEELQERTSPAMERERPWQKPPKEDESES